MTWADSRANCKKLRDGADLVAIETKQENEFLINMITGEAYTYLLSGIIIIM